VLLLFSRDAKCDGQTPLKAGNKPGNSDGSEVGRGTRSGTDHRAGRVIAMWHRESGQLLVSG